MTIETELPAVKVKVLPLDWRDGRTVETVFSVVQHATILGAEDLIGLEYTILGPDRHGLFEVILGDKIINYGNSEEQAKTVAQLDYERRIIPALTLKDDPGNGGKPVICIGYHTINQLMAGQDVEIEAAIMVPASDLCQPTPVDLRIAETRAAALEEAALECIRHAKSEMPITRWDWNPWIKGNLQRVTSLSRKMRAKAFIRAAAAIRALIPRERS